MWVLLATLELAQAGGPWVPGEGVTSVYVGTDAQRIDKLATSEGNFGGELIDVGDGLSKFYVKGILAHGLTARTALELSVPYARVSANREDAQVCADLTAAVGRASCTPTSGIGIITLRGRGMLLDELAGAPLTFSLGFEARHGELTAATRSKLTNLGEGTFDFGPTLSIGRTGAFMSGWWYAFADNTFRYRVPLTEKADRAIPGSEFDGELDVAFVPNGTVGFGPAVIWFARPWGVDFEDADLTDVDRFSMLKVTNVSAGAKLLVRSSKRTTFVASGIRSVYAVNNPIVWTAGFGVQIDDAFAKEQD
jgi:hypothetical protein